MWTKENLQEMLKQKLEGYQFMVVSNREPYSHEYEGRKIKCFKAIGGLVTALDSVLQSTGGTWIAYGSGDADKDVVDKNDIVRMPVNNPRYNLKRIWLTKEEENDFYYGYSNQALWPLCHIVYRQPLFNVSHYNTYLNVNKKFAAAVLDIAGKEKSFVWTQDYQMCLVAKFIKEANPGIITALFWHIPWPNPEVFRICPQKIEIMEGLLSNDLLGFHIHYHCHRFLEACEQEIEAKVQWEEMSVTYKGHTTLVRPFPISIDTQNVSSQANLHFVKNEIDNLPDEIDPPYEILAVGVDRIDYTKGIVEKLYAIDRFLEKYPQYQGRFVFFQQGALSRLHIKYYKEYIDRIQALTEEINWKYRCGKWYPIVLNNRRTEYYRQLALYRAADICIVSSLHDGMNLVSKEFVASNTDFKGMLILSKFTGASRELKEAILINPYDIENFADSIKEAIELSQDEKTSRVKKMQETIEENNVYKWAGKFIENLAKL